MVFWAALVALTLLAADPDLADLTLPYGRYLLPWMPACAAILVAAAPFAPSGRRLLDLAPLRALGTISYGVYIFHMPVMQLVHRFLPIASDTATTKLQFAVVSLALTVVVATASYFVLERPLLQWAKRPLPEPLTVA